MKRRVRLASAAAITLASWLGVARTARADDGWDASLRAGYAAAWTTGVSSLGVGLGASAGYVFPARIRLEVVAVWSAGDTDGAGNGAITYRSSYSSLRGTAGAAYEIPIGPVRLRPGVQTGATLIYGFTRVGPTKIRDGEPRFIVGPAIEAVVRLGRYDLGVAAEAFFLPSWVAAPSAGIYALSGVRF
jgi:hypothetical protein